MKEVKNEKLEKLIEDIKNGNISNEEIQILLSMLENEDDWNMVE